MLLFVEISMLVQHYSPPSCRKLILLHVLLKMWFVVHVANGYFLSASCLISIFTMVLRVSHLTILVLGKLAAQLLIISVVDFCQPHFLFALRP